MSTDEEIEETTLAAMGAKRFKEITRLLRSGNGAAEDGDTGSTGLIMGPFGVTTNVENVEGTETGVVYTAIASDIDSVGTGMAAGQVDGAGDDFCVEDVQFAAVVNDQAMHMKMPIVSAKKSALASEENTAKTKVCIM